MHHVIGGIAVEPVVVPNADVAARRWTAFIPLLEDATAIPLEFIHFAIHLVGKHSVLRP
jgi:hypothetical protein